MKRLKIFISSVQSEFAEERKAIADYLRGDVLLKQFFVPFLFEEVPANNDDPAKVYLQEVGESDIYLGLLGAKYGYEDKQGISPTEREYDKAKEDGVQRWIFISEAQKRHNKELNFIRKIEQDVSRKKFNNHDNLQKAVYQSCIRFLQQKGFIDSNEFDSSTHLYAKIELLDDELLHDFVRTAQAKRNFPFKESDPPESILTALNLLRNNELINSSLLLFSNNPQQYFPSATIKCAHFHGVTIQKPIPDYKEFKGNVFNMADNAVDFILSKISLSTGARDASNIIETVYEIPRAAIAEAVINAVAHRDYTSRGSIQISVFKDRVEISNPGKLPQELNLDDLRLPHTSYPQNPLLAECMFQYGAIERYGTGTLDIYKLINQSGLKDPDFHLKEGFMVVLWRPSVGTDHVTDYVTDHVTDHVITGISDLTHRLVFILDDEMSRQELMNILSLKHIPTFRENYLTPALEGGLIEMTLPNTPKSVKQKYRLTGKGVEIRKKIENHGKQN